MQRLRTSRPSNNIIRSPYRQKKESNFFNLLIHEIDVSLCSRNKTQQRIAQEQERHYKIQEWSKTKYNVVVIGSDKNELHFKTVESIPQVRNRFFITLDDLSLLGK